MKNLARCTRLGREPSSPRGNAPDHVSGVLNLGKSWGVRFSSKDRMNDLKIVPAYVERGRILFGAGVLRCALAGESTSRRR